MPQPWNDILPGVPRPVSPSPAPGSQGASSLPGESLAFRRTGPSFSVVSQHLQTLTWHRRHRHTYFATRFSLAEKPSPTQPSPDASVRRAPGTGADTEQPPPRRSQAGRDRQVRSKPSCACVGRQAAGRVRGEAAGADHRPDVCVPQDGHTQHGRKGRSVPQSLMKHR